MHIGSQSYGSISSYIEAYLPFIYHRCSYLQQGEEYLHYYGTACNVRKPWSVSKQRNVSLYKWKLTFSCVVVIIRPPRGQNASMMHLHVYLLLPYDQLGAGPTVCRQVEGSQCSCTRNRSVCLSVPNLGEGITSKMQTYLSYRHARTANSCTLDTYSTTIHIVYMYSVQPQICSAMHVIRGQGTLLAVTPPRAKVLYSDLSITRRPEYSLCIWMQTLCLPFMQYR